MRFLVMAGGAPLVTKTRDDARGKIVTRVCRA
jgi:hypothetical protein